MLPRLESTVGVVVCAATVDGRHARRASTAIANICPPENIFPGALLHIAAPTRRPPLPRVHVQLSAHPGPVSHRCVSCYRPAPYAHTHRRCLACCRIRVDQLRVGGTNVADAGDQQRRSFTLQQPRNAGAHTVANAAAIAISVAHTVTVAGDRHGSRSSDGDAESSSVQRAADYGYRELCYPTEYLVLRSGPQRNRRRRGDRDEAGRHV
jgi:hypothetical protein